MVRVRNFLEISRKIGINFRKFSGENFHKFLLSQPYNGTLLHSPQKYSSNLKETFSEPLSNPLYKPGK